MEHFTDNPIADAQEHVNSQDKQEHVYDYKCDACKEGFDHGHGVEIHDEKFCNFCVDHNEHIAFYKGHGLTNFEVYEATSSSKDL